MNIEIGKMTELSSFLFYYRKLQKIAKSLSRLDVLACNVGLTDKQEAKLAKLEAEAERLANEMGLKSYHQGDPRGLSLYLIDESMDNTNYHNGIAVY
jgi:hypothetical protein